MKHIPFYKYLFIYFILCQIQILAHGFGGQIPVATANKGFWTLEQIYEIQAVDDQLILSYDSILGNQVKKHIIAAGKSQTNCYFKIIFDEFLSHNILCTPSQEFYLPSQKEWIFAYQLKVGDELLCKNNEAKKIIGLEFIKRPLPVYSIEIEHTHTYFAGALSVLTHNMALPIAAAASLGVSFGSGAVAERNNRKFFWTNNICWWYNCWRYNRNRDSNISQR